MDECIYMDEGMDEWMDRLDGWTHLFIIERERVSVCVCVCSERTICRDQLSASTKWVEVEMELGSSSLVASTLPAESSLQYRASLLILILKI